MSEVKEKIDRTSEEESKAPTLKAKAKSKGQTTFLSLLFCWE